MGCSFQGHSRHARRFLAAEVEVFWPGAAEDLVKLQDLVRHAAKKPTEANVRKAVNAAGKQTGVAVWAMKCLAPDEYQVFVVARREIFQLLKDKGAALELLQRGLDRYLAAVRAALECAAPGRFIYSGFEISNPERVSDRLCRQVLDGLDFLRAVFKKRGVVKLIDRDIERVVLTLDIGGGIAHFNSGTRELVVSVPGILKGHAARILGGVGFVGETLLHEFGHYVHRVYIKGEAEAAWNAPWEGVPSLANPRVVQLPEGKRKQKLDPLEIVTEYGKTDQYEDFAETFVVFMAAPEKLTPTAKFRMQRALSLSGLYGKPVMRLAGAVLARFLAASRQEPLVLACVV